MSSVVSEVVSPAAEESGELVNGDAPVEDAEAEEEEADIKGRLPRGRESWWMWLVEKVWRLVLRAARM